MEQETISDYPSRTEKVFKDREIWFAALLGGTLAAGYMVARNYRAFGETGKARTTWVVTGAATAFIFYISFFAPFIDRMPSQLFALVCAGIVVVLVQMYQGERIRRHVRAGGLVQSWWKTIGVAIAGLCVTLVLFVGLAAIVTVADEMNTRTKNYGRMRHEVSYNTRNISESEVDRLAEAAMKTNLFLDSSGKWFAYVRRVGNDYEIFVSVNRATLTDADYLKFFGEQRGYIQAQFPNNKIVINLVEGDYGKIEKRIE